MLQEKERCPEALQTKTHTDTLTYVCMYHIYISPNKTCTAKAKQTIRYVRELERERAKIREEKDLFIMKIGKQSKMTQKIGKQLKAYQHSINQLNGKIRTLKQWLAR